MGQKEAPGPWGRMFYNKPDHSNRIKAVWTSPAKWESTSISVTKALHTFLVGILGSLGKKVLENNRFFSFGIWAFQLGEEKLMKKNQSRH